MRVLVLASYIPSRFKGAEIRLLQLLRHLSREHEITLWAINRRGVPASEIAQELPGVALKLFQPADYEGPIRRRLLRFGWYRRLRELLGRMFGRLPYAAARIYQPGLKRSLQATLASGRFDLVQVTQIMVGAYLPKYLALPLVLSKDNVWADLSEQEYRRASGVFARRLAWLEWRRMLRYEKSIVDRSDLCVVVSSEDRDRIARMSPTAKLRVVPNGVDTAYFRPAPGNERPHSMVFTGTMSWTPNEDAMLFFTSAIFPRIRERFPAATVRIVGVQPPDSVRALAALPGVEVTGGVPDVRPFVEAAAVFIVPLRAGSGSRLKILEAFGMGKAVVSTTIGAEGLDTVDGQHLLIADDPKAFADQVCRLFLDDSLRAALGERGRRLVEDRYDWKILATQMEAVYREAVEGRL